MPSGPPSSETHSAETTLPFGQVPSGRLLRHRIRTAGLSLERWVKQQRWWLRHAHCRRVLAGWLEDHRQPSETSPVTASAPKRCLLDLRKIANDGEQGRRFHALISLLSRGGYELSMVPRLSFLQTGHRPFKAAALKSIRPLLEDDLTEDFQPFDICLRDRPGPHPLAHRTLQVLADTTQTADANTLALPYSFYPSVWDRGEDERFASYRSHPRIWRLFFGGHCSEASYRRIKKYPWLSPLDRYHVVQETLQYFSEATLHIESHEQLRSAQRQRHESFVFIDNAGYRTEAAHWLGLLAQADFFLAAPGCDYPLSHNAVESIAVGTIPVLEYDSLFTPSLRDGVNCIAYRGRDGLRHALKRIEQMSASEIDHLRQGVIEYYECHLSPTAFCRQLNDPRFQRLHLFSYLTPGAGRGGAAWGRAVQYSAVRAA